MKNIEYLGVVGSLASIVSLLAFRSNISKFFIRFLEPNELDPYLQSLNLRSQCRIAIVDDELTDFPISYLSNSGYKITTFSSIEMSEFNKLLDFDIVFLDVQGVVKSDFEYGGAKLIRLLVKDKPLLPIVAVSSGQFKASLTEFFELSYDRINKPVDEVKLATVIDEICAETFDFKNISEEINNLLSCAKVKNQSKIIKFIIGYLNGRLSESELENFIHEKTPYKFSSKIIYKCKLLKVRVNNA